MSYYVYILTNKPFGALYTGVTGDLIKRIYEHKQAFSEGFTNNYWLKRLVYFETHESVHAAIQREKNIKQWLRKWKIELIEKENPTWNDLWDEIVK